jgi:biotin transport system substrate-specific component
MTNLTLAYGRPTLADRIVSRRLVTDIALVAGGAALTSLMAQIAIPLWPVPITGQTFAVLFVGTTLGAARGSLSMLLYMAVGLLGLPVFAPQADGSHIVGLAALLGPTGGYLVGFILAAAVTGWLAQRQWDHRVLRTVAAFVLGTVAIYAIGIPWLFVSLTNLGIANPVQATLSGGLYPFLIGDTIKALVAGGLLPLVWRALGSSKTDKA